jgi:hypothetical protein
LNGKSQFSQLGKEICQLQHDIHNCSTSLLRTRISHAFGSTKIAPDFLVSETALDTSERLTHQPPKWHRKEKLRSQAVFLLSIQGNISSIPNELLNFAVIKEELQCFPTLKGFAIRHYPLSRLIWQCTWLM